LLYTQEWSFVSSVVTPSEGTRWFPRIAGVTSLIGMISGSLVPYVVAKIGLIGLMTMTCLTLCITLWCQDQAYQIATENGFCPQQDTKQKDTSRWTQTVTLFQRVPTLRALLLECMAFQSCNTILGTAFVSSLKETIPDNLLRASYTGRFYALINAIAALFQFVCLPFVLHYMEPATMWRIMPILPLIVCCAQAMQSNLSLTLLAAAFFLAKVMDYSMRSVIYPMAFQPLDFEARYIGKEVIGVLGGRLGKSGMSLLLSLFTTIIPTFGVRELVYLSVGASMSWTSGAWWLSRLIPDKATAEAIVEERKKK
jgi:ATP/ADP translocase